MNRIDSRSILLASLAALALCACSSSDDDDPDPVQGTITPQNARQVSAVASSVSGLLDLAGAPLGIVRGMKTVGFAGLGTEPEVVNCTDGGTVTFTFTDTAPTDELSPGDGFEVDFADCSEDGSTINGSYSFTIDALAETKTNATLGLSFLVTGLTLVEGEQTITQEGALSESLDFDTVTGDAGYTLTGFFDSSYDEGGTTLTSNLTNIDVSADYFAEMDIAASRFNCTYETNVAASASFTVTTLEDFVSFGADANPTEGRATIAAGGDTLFMTAQADGIHVLFELDQATDGSIDWTELVPWDEI